MELGLMASPTSHGKKEKCSGLSGIILPSVGSRKVSESSTLYDVFINHRGPDVKETLARELYNSLQKLEIRAFLEPEDTNLGISVTSFLETVIRSASVHIAIFSKRYAESPWCLAELVLMVQSKAKIIPVFYEVQPWELRYIERGAYAEAFMKYEEKGRYLEKLNEWKEALRSLSFITGVQVNRFDDCKTILAAVQKEVQRKQCLHVAKYPVGLDNLIQDLENQLKVKGREEEKDKVKAVGIFGMAGVGKTTLAIELFNRGRSEYTRASFLFGVREASMRGNLSYLQCKLLKDLFGIENLNFASIEEGTSHLKNCIKRSSSSSFYIVVDDIDRMEQLDALLVMNIINETANSMVIVTTRDARVLINAGIAGYNMKAMNKDIGRELFCWHAFGQRYPCSGYELLVDDFLDVCGGLPLSLQILGSHVHGGSDDYWRLRLNKARTMLPGDVKQILRTSFDALDSEERQVFMDIACFFLGKPKSIAKRVFEGSGWNSQALETLKDKCLVEEIQNLSLNKGEIVFAMHEHLRDLGREMALELGPPRRLWRPQDLKYLELKGFKNILDQTNVRCFHSIFDESTGFQFKFFFCQSDNMSRSFLWLQLERNSKEQLYSSIHAPSQLKEMDVKADVEAEGSEMKELEEKISSLPVEEMHVKADVEAEGSEMKELEKKNSSLPVKEVHVKAHVEAKGSLMNKLKEKISSLPVKKVHVKSLVEAKGSLNKLKEKISSLPVKEVHVKADVEAEGSVMNELKENFSSLPDDLADLRWDGFPLRNLPSWLALKALGVLELHDANELEELWEDKAHAPLHLRELIVTGTWSASFQRFPSSISNLKCLKKIALLGDVGKEFGIKGLPEEFCDLQSLEHLELRHCTLLSSLPTRFGSLRSLQHLDLCSCKGLRKLPNSFKQLRQLEYFDLSGCKNLALQIDILENITGLKNVNLSRCLKLRQLPRHITDQAWLRELRLQDTRLDVVQPNIGKLRKLEWLTIGSPFLKSLPDSLGEMSSLKSLSIVDCIDLESLPETLGRLSLLEHLCIRSSGVKSLPKGLTELINLQTLKISGCPLGELDLGSGSSSQLGNLRVIEISETRVARISMTENCCPRLEKLHISRNDYLEKIDTLPTTVKNIEFSECENLIYLPSKML